jgi:hypothetical protein
MAIAVPAELARAAASAQRTQIKGVNRARRLPARNRRRSGAVTSEEDVYRRDPGSRRVHKAGVGKNEQRQVPKVPGVLGVPGVLECLVLVLVLVLGAWGASFCAR